MIDNKDLKRVQKRLGALKHKAPNVISNSLNRAITNLRSNVVKKTREEYFIKAKQIRSTMKIKKSNRSSLGAMVTSEGNKEPITSYKVTPKKPTKIKRHVKVAVKKGDPKTLLDAFIIEKYGNQIFKRYSYDRFPIEQIYGPAIPQILGNEETREFVEKEAWKTYEKRLDHEINRVLEAKR